MARYSFGSKGGKIRRQTVPSGVAKEPDAVVRELAAARARPPGEDYRERSMALHGLVCARCAREFEARNRHLLTVHHKDGDHHNNPPDGSNWENLCADCHEDVHSRLELGRHLDGGRLRDDRRLVFEDEGTPSSGDDTSSLGQLLREALRKRSSDDS